MKATLLHNPFLTVEDVCDGFVYNQLEGKGLFGWGGKLVIQPEYQVTSKKGIFEYILGGEKDARLLNVRVFSKKDAKAVYTKQTASAQKKGVSNCPLCAIGHEANKKKIWSFEEMDADHVTAWSKGGTTDIKNCQMLCKTHNRAKGNR